MCFITPFNVRHALYDVVARINLIPLVIYKLLGENSFVKKPMGVIYNIVVRVSSFMFPNDFMILYCDMDFQAPIILGRTFLATSWAFIGMELEQMMF